MAENLTPANATSHQNSVRIEPWDEGDLPLLKKLLGDPAMMTYLGGPESDAQLANRQARYERLTDKGIGRMFKIIHLPTGVAVGSVGYWETHHQDQPIYETGWSVLLAYQGQGIAYAGMLQLLPVAKADGKYRCMHAFPAVENLASNALCRKLGFALIEEIEGEYPKGHFMRCNDWRADLSAGG
jgi:RimJ/RimL family protein N-acetyltransferase